jgi:hypothetical protein
VAWQTVPPDEHRRLCNEWDAVYGNAFAVERRVRHRAGARAQEAYARQTADTFLIVPFLGRRGGPHDINKPGPRIAAYACRNPEGGLPGFSTFANIDFFVAPPDLECTMVHTHEDHAYGGPYFVRKEWLVPPARRAKW